MQKTFASAHILTILYKDEGKLHYFRVTTLLAMFYHMTSCSHLHEIQISHFQQASK